MSRIGNLPIELPSQVEFNFGKDQIATIKGPKGTLKQYINPSITITQKNQKIYLKRNSDQKQTKAYHGLYRSLIYNMVQGVNVGFKETLELFGIGYKAILHQEKTFNNILELNLGYSHSIFFVIPAEIEVKVETLKGKNPTIYLESFDKQLLGQISAKILSLKKIDPYKGKGVRKVGQKIILKPGKAKSK